MPKTNDATGATYAGYEGVVEHADGRLSQLDPNRNADGTVVEGFESEERELEDREGAPAADFGEVHSSDPEQRSDAQNAERRGSDAGRQEQAEQAEEGEQSSRGASSSPSSKSGESNSEKKPTASRSSARTTANRS